MSTANAAVRSSHMPTTVYSVSGIIEKAARQSSSEDADAAAIRSSNAANASAPPSSSTTTILPPTSTTTHHQANQSCSNKSRRQQRHHHQHHNNNRRSSVVSSASTCTSMSSSSSASSSSLDVKQLRENHISVANLEDLNDDDFSSSIVDSDSDLDGLSVNGILRQAVVGNNNGGGKSAIHSNGMIVINKGASSSAAPVDVISGASGAVLGTHSGSQRPNIGSIALQNSTDITFGDKTFYQGPVTVKQFFLEKDQWRRHHESQSAAAAEGRTNAGFEHADGRDMMVVSKGDSGDKDKSAARQIKTANAPNNDGDLAARTQNWWHKLLHAQCRPLAWLTLLVALLLVVASAIALFVTHNLAFMQDDMSAIILPIGDGDDSRLSEPTNLDIGGDLTNEFGTSIRYVSRKQWLAQPPKAHLRDLALPSTRVIIAHTATEGCLLQAECVYSVRTIQSYHMDSLGWDDIGYNFLIGGDGAVYIGRGWDKQGAHTRSFNQKSICIAFVGTFIDRAPSKRQLHPVQALLEEGMLQQKLSVDYRLYGHRQLIATESPGRALYELLQTWPHWYNTTTGSTTR